MVYKRQYINICGETDRSRWFI